MISIVTIYEQNNISGTWEALAEEALNDQCKYYASEIMDFLKLDEASFNLALTQAEKALRILNFPLKYHFRHIYRATAKGVIKDVKLSPLAVYFLSIHADPENAQVARLQLYIASRYDL